MPTEPRPRGRLGARTLVCPFEGLPPAAYGGSPIGTSGFAGGLLTIEDCRLIVTFQQAGLRHWQVASISRG